MKSFTQIALTLSAFLLVASTATAQPTERMVFTTPFPFVAAGQLVPAGTYEMQWLASGSAILTADGNKQTLLVFLVDPAPVPYSRDASGAEVTFTKLSDGSYALDQLLDRDSQTGVQVVWTALNGGRGLVAEPSQPGHAGDIRVPAVLK